VISKGYSYRRKRAFINKKENCPYCVVTPNQTNSRYKFSIGASKFVNDWNNYGPAHHCAVGIGHISPKIKTGRFVEYRSCEGVLDCCYIWIDKNEEIKLNFKL